MGAAMSISDYWDNAHLTNSISSLSGHHLNGHLDSLKVRDLINPSTNVLCIGVGMGDWINELYDNVNNVWAVDISQHSKFKLDDRIRFQSQLEFVPSNYFDLALSLWVTPHISLETLQVQVDNVLRTLKHGGIFAMHYNEPTGELANVYDKQNLLQSGGSHRTKEEIDVIVSVTNGRIIKSELIHECKDYNINMMMVHIQK
jgi:SAM-dependent methyltransferase